MYYYFGDQCDVCACALQSYAMCLQANLYRPQGSKHACMHACFHCTIAQKLLLCYCMDIHEMYNYTRVINLKIHRRLIRHSQLPPVCRCLIHVAATIIYTHAHSRVIYAINARGVSLPRYIYIYYNNMQRYIYNIARACRY